MDRDRQIVTVLQNHVVGDRFRRFFRRRQVHVVHGPGQANVGTYACQLQRACIFIVLVNGAVATVVRCDRRATSSLGRCSLELFKPGLIAQGVPEGTVSTEFVDVIEPAGAYVNSASVSGPPGNIAFRRTNAGCAFTIELPLAGQRRDRFSHNSKRPPFVGVRFDGNGHGIAVQYQHLVNNGSRRIKRVRQLFAVNDFCEAQVQACASDR